MLHVMDLQLNYGKKQVLNGISFHLKKGECIGILGTNGCGKSTLLKILAGVLTPAAGTILYHGEDACSNPKLFVSYAGYVPQDNPLMEELTVKDNLRLWYADSRADLNWELEHGVLHMLKLHTVLKSRVSTLSGGMKKRISLGCALANRPSVLILDEPMAALDLPCKEELRSYFQMHLQNGGAIVITTHEEPDLALCSQLYALKHGILESIPDSIRGRQLSEFLQSDQR